jgi:uncharacterized protein (TIGR03435 family)
MSAGLCESMRTPKMIGGKLKFSLKLIGLAPLAAVALVGLIIVGLTASVWAQSAATQSPVAQLPAFQVSAATAAKAAFDVASVKPNKSTERPNSNVALAPGVVSPPTGGLFSATNMPLIAYITFAYNLTSSQFVQLQPQLPRWATTEGFDIQARAQDNPTGDQMRLMMQSLLADRFKLVVHTETKQGPVYSLVLSKAGKTGPQLQPHPDDGACAKGGVGGALPGAGDVGPVPCGYIQRFQPSVPGRMRIGARNVTVALIAIYLSIPLTGVERPVIDRTGLSGTFDFSIEFTPELNGPPPPNFQPDTAGPTFLEALQDQLGLKLEPQTGPLNVFVIDHLEEPSPN